MKISVFTLRLRENAKYVLDSIKKNKTKHTDIGGLTKEESTPEWAQANFLCILKIYSMFEINSYDFIIL